MPHIRIRSMTASQAQALSEDLPGELAKIMKTPEDNFTLELMETEFYQNGKMVTSDPLIEIHWFDRGQEAKDASAKKVTQAVKQISSANDVIVIFINLSKDSYYENGKHFGG